MASSSAFNEMYSQFLGELAQTFPEEPAIAKALKKHKDEKTYKKVMNKLTPWAQQIMEKDPKFFCEDNEFVGNLNLHEIWKKDDISDATRQAIWQYISSLYGFGVTLQMIPPGFMSVIESEAEKCANDLKDSGGELNEAAIMSAAQSMMSKLLAGGGIPGLPGVQPKRRESKRDFMALD
jgi:hypothetical protein